MKKVGYKTKLDFVVIQLLSQVQLFCDPTDYSPPGSSVHGISQAGVLNQVVISFSRESSQPRDGIHISFVSCIVRQILNHRAYITKSMELASKLTDRSREPPRNRWSRNKQSHKLTPDFLQRCKVNSVRIEQIFPSIGVGTTEYSYAKLANVYFFPLMMGK